jgi:hypothetical protein
MNTKHLITVFFLVTLFVVTCDNAPPPSGHSYGMGSLSDAKPHYHLATHPLLNPKKLIEAGMNAVVSKPIYSTVDWG